MRVIGGQWKGRKIHVPSKSWPVRPTTDFAREALFNILDNRVDYEQIAALDLFGGTGMHSIELFSRGCTAITYVDRYRDSARFMMDFAKEWSLPIKVVQRDVAKFIAEATHQWDYIFADPPYDMQGVEEFPGLLLSSGILRENGFFVLEHFSGKTFTGVQGFVESRNYGQSVFSFFSRGS